MNTTSTSLFRMPIAAVLALMIAAIAPHAHAESTLSAKGQELEKRYAAMLSELRAEIVEALPAVSEEKKAAYTEALAAEKAAKAAVGKAKGYFSQLKQAEYLVGHANWKWIAGAEKGIAAAKKQLEQAKTDADREKAKAVLAKWQKNLADGQQALKERTAKFDALKAQEAAKKKALADAEQAHAQARAEIDRAIDAMGIGPFLASDELDGRLAKFVVLRSATPAGLAAFAEQGPEQATLIDRLLDDEQLMIQMAMADGAKRKRLPGRQTRYGPAEYGAAMTIYNNIQQASPKARDGVLQRLAVAVSLEHAVPISQRNAANDTDAPKHVDPVNRYLHFEKAYLAGELDPGFPSLSVWDYRWVVDGEEPDEILSWGREMLRNYRPDHIRTDDYRWRYVALVRTDIKYGSSENRFDKPDLQFFQNILMNGGVCGRRAFIGRFILRAFGIPTVPRPQRGHAALAHWTPDGWVVCLGGGWGAGYAPQKYNSDLNFLAETQGRATGKPYAQVKRAQWVGDVMGEKRCAGLVGNEPAFWNAVALYRQHAIIDQAKTVTLAAVGEELGEANESNVKYAIEAASITEADQRITVDAKGAITIPAVACSTPTQSTGKIIFMQSHGGGKQLHYSRNGNDQDFEYTFDVPAAGRYALTARVVTPSWKQHIHVITNDGEPVDIALPHTVGMWETTESVMVDLVKGKNTLRFTRKGVKREVAVKGITFKQFRLVPVNSQ